LHQPGDSLSRPPKNRVVSQPETGLSPAAVRQYLADTSQRELDALRAALDKRLAALEAALANPGESEALEHLVIALARVATAEADATATRLCLQARVEAQEEVAASHTAAEERLQTERSAAAELRSSLDQTKVALGEESRTAKELRRELDQARSAIEVTRAEEERLRHEFQESQTTLEAEHAAGELLCRTLEDTRAALEAERAAAATLHAALDKAEQGIAASEREHALAIRAIQERSDHDRGLEQASAALLVEQLAARDRDLDEARHVAEARQADIEHARRAAAAHQEQLDAARRAAEAQRDELEAARRAADARRDDLEAAAAQLDGLEAQYAATEKNRAALEQACQEATARAEAAQRDRDALARELHDLKQAAGAVEADAQTQSTRRDTELAETEHAWKDAETRAETAARDLEARSAELRAEREMAMEAGVQHEEMRESFEQRIRDLERQLADLALVPLASVDSPEVEVVISLDELALEDEPPPAMPTVDAPPVQADQPLRAASRHAFHHAVQVLIDGDAAGLADLSITGAQVTSPTPLKPNRVVKLQLPSDTTPIACRGKIVWARLEPQSPGAPPRYRAGVYFMGVDLPAVATFLADYAARR
jgi:chromosome segregation ATPase